EGKAARVSSERVRATERVSTFTSLILLFRRNDRRQHTANSFADAFTSNIKSADGRIDLLTPARLKLASSPTRSLLPSQFYLLCRFSQKFHSALSAQP